MLEMKENLNTPHLEAGYLKDISSILWGPKGPPNLSHPEYFSPKHMAVSSTGGTPLVN